MLNRIVHLVGLTYEITDACIYAYAVMLPHAHFGHASTKFLCWTNAIACRNGDDKQEETVHLLLCSCMSNRRFKAPYICHG